MNNIILNFTNAYRAEWMERLRAEYGFSIIDCTDITGCDMYVDDTAREEIMSRVRRASESRGGIYSGIHFCDSGNFHYMTRLFTEELSERYDLIYFDHHTDMKPSMIPELLSCGAWVRHMLEDKNVSHILPVGVPREDLDEAGAHPKLCATVEDIDMSLPLYISIDKDVLSAEYAVTNWSQGDMSLSELLAHLQRIFSAQGGRILGVDICGELPGVDSSVNESTNNALLELCLSSI